MRHIRGLSECQIQAVADVPQKWPDVRWCLFWVRHKQQGTCSHRDTQASWTLRTQFSTSFGLWAPCSHIVRLYGDTHDASQERGTRDERDKRGADVRRVVGPSAGGGWAHTGPARGAE